MDNDNYCCEVALAMPWHAGSVSADRQQGCILPSGYHGYGPATTQDLQIPFDNTSFPNETY